jgi:ribosomal protein S18 acetylase RimI-like enzyme
MLDDVLELWSELNQFHIEKSLHFKDYYANLEFYSRKKQLETRAQQGAVFVIIAFAGEQKIGHCVASFVDEIGMIESLFVKPSYRREHVGSTLIESALEWLHSHDPRHINLKVAVGNEEAFSFYAKYGFKPRSTELQMQA